MIKKITAMIICMAMMLTCVPAAAFADTAIAVENTYVIKTEEDLNSIRNDLDGHYVLESDIEITSAEWEPVGDGPKNAFTGIIDGNGHTISGLNLVGNSDNGDYLGFVGYNKGKITDIVLEDCSLISKKGGLGTCYQGIIAGYNDSAAEITGCLVKNGTVEHFSNSGEVFAGMVAGFNDGTVSAAGASGTVTGEHIIHAKANIGGLVGRNNENGVMEQVCTDVTIDSRQNLTTMKMSYWGGVCGFNAGRIKDCFSTGQMQVTSDLNSKGKSYLGGLTGALGKYAVIETSYQYADLSGAYTKKGNVYGNGESTADVMAVYYVDSNNLTCNSGVPLRTADMLRAVIYNGFDFESVWLMDEDSGYPFPQLRAVPFDGSVTQYPMTECTVEQMDAVTYNGRMQEVKPVISYNDTILKEDFDYVLSYSDNINAGTATVQIRGIGHFAGKRSVGFEIMPMDISGLAATLEATEYTCNGKAIRPAATIQSMTEGIDYTVSYTGNIDPGTAAAEITGIGNYTGTVVCEFTIIKPQVPALTKSTASLSGKYNTVRASWTKIKGVTGYKVMWKKASAKKWNSKRVTGSGAVLSGLNSGARYTVKVIPYVKLNGKFYEGKGTTATVYTLKKLNKPSVKRAAAGKVKVSWNNINGETGYQISRALKAGGTNVVATVKTTTGKSKVVKAPKGKTYYYKVRAYKTVNGKKIFGPWSKTYRFKNR